MSKLRHMRTPVSPDAGASSHNFATSPAEAWRSHWPNRFAQLSRDTQARLGVPLGTALQGDPLPTPRWVVTSESLARASMAKAGPGRRGKKTASNGPQVA